MKNYCINRAFQLSVFYTSCFSLKKKSRTHRETCIRETDKDALASAGWVSYIRVVEFCEGCDRILRYIEMYRCA